MNSGIRSLESGHIDADAITMNLATVKKFMTLISNDVWRSIHDRRRLTANELNSRNAVTIAFAGGLLALLMAAVSVKAIKPADWESYESGRDGFQLLAENHIHLSGAAPRTVNCDTDCDELGIPKSAFTPHTIKTPSDLNDPAISRAILPTSSQARFWAQINYTFLPESFSSVKDGRESVILSLHKISYIFASVKVNDVPWGTYADNRPIRLSLPVPMLSTSPVKVQIVYTVHNNGVTFLNRADLIPPFVSTVNELKRIENFESSNYENNGAMVGLMSRILIGVFALMLFLFMDSAPESLGLALLLGFEGLALGLSQGWISTKINPFIIHYCSQMGDIFRLYFFMQLARIIKPHPVQWLIVGTILSVPYGFAKQMEIAWGIDGLAVIPRFRDLFAGSVGALACLRTLWSIKGMNLPWRRIALILGALGSIQQVIGPITHYIPELNQSETFRGFFVVFEALSVYVLALSTFTNISTLENRVKNLSAAKARGDLIEQELELGRTVQRAFLNIPALPKDFDVTGSHEAAVYVSGDIYFVHWDEVEQRLVILLADVTGHGVQASLKATACFMVARNLWQTTQIKGARSFTTSQKSKMDSYHRQTTEMLTLFSEAPEIATFAGIEIFPRSRNAIIYRNNFHAPIVLEPDSEGRWNLKIPSIRIAEPVNYGMKPGTILALFSDGFIEGSRQLSQLSKFINKKLPDFDGRPNTLKEIFAAFNEQNLNRPDDDRTLVIVSWKRDEYLASLRKVS